MAFTQAELSALERAYASGTTRVTYEGKTIEYDTEAALLRRINLIRAALEAEANGGKRPPTVGYASFSRR